MKRIPHLFFTLLYCLGASVVHAGVINTTVALTGDTAPGTGGQVYGGFLNGAKINNNNEILFAAYLTGPSNQNNALFKVDADGSQLIARKRDSIPDAGTNLAGFASPSNYTIADNGDVVFYSSTSAGAGFFRHNGSTLERILLRGDEIGGAGASGGYGSGAQDTIVNASANLIQHNHALTGPGIGNGNNGVVFRTLPDGGAEVIAQEGDSAPGTGKIFIDDGLGIVFQYEAINNLGDVAFAGRIGSGATGYALFREQNHVLGLIAQPGDLAPGGGTFSGNFSQIRINDAGEVAFVSDVNGGAGRAVFIFDGLSIRRVASVSAPTALEFNNAGDLVWREIGALTAEIDGLVIDVLTSGDMAPGIPDTILKSPQPAFSINDDGAIAVLTTLQGIGEPRAIYYFQDGVFDLIATTGDLLEVRPGDFREIEALIFEDVIGFDDTNLSNDGVVVYRADFTDNSSGIFTSRSIRTSTSIPTPSSIMLLILVLPVLNAKEGMLPFSKR